MTAWMKERDRLVQQTMAFVQGVAAQRPIKMDSADVKSPEPAVPLFSVKPFERAKPVEAAKPFEATKPLETAKPAETPKPAEPVLKIPTSDASLVEAEALMSLIAKSLPSLRPEPSVPAAPVTLGSEKSVSKSSVSEPLAASAPTYASPARSNAPVYVPVPKRMSHLALPQREMIAQCVSNFRSFQLRLIRERESNYAMVQAKIRESLGNDSRA